MGYAGINCSQFHKIEFPAPIPSRGLIYSSNKKKHDITVWYPVVQLIASGLSRVVGSERFGLVWVLRTGLGENDL